MKKYKTIFNPIVFFILVTHGIPAWTSRLDGFGNNFHDVSFEFTPARNKRHGSLQGHHRQATRDYS